MATNTAVYLKAGQRVDHYVIFEQNHKRLRAVVGGETIADTTHARLLLETAQLPVYYFPRADVRLAQLEPSEHRSTCPYKGTAAYWSVHGDGRVVSDGAWSYVEPTVELGELKGFIAFDWIKLDRRLEEDEEVFGHPRDPYHCIDVRASNREVRVLVRDDVVAQSRRALFLFETGLPTRYYIPPQDVRTERLTKTETTSVCPYKGAAAYWSLRVGDVIVKDVAWSYPHPLPECPRIKDYFCFYPERVDKIEVENI